MAQVSELFQAYQAGKLPVKGGYIVSVFYHSNSTYTRYEMISFSNVKDIYATEEGLTFQAEGRKVYVLVEPASYPNRHTEPAYRTDAERIPYRLKELNDYTTKRQDHVYIGKEPVVTYTNFTVLKPVGTDVSYVFHPTEDVRETIVEFFRKSLWKQANVPQTDARKIAELVDEAFGKIVVQAEYT
jgi:hypothetical protein